MKPFTLFLATLFYVLSANSQAPADIKAADPQAKSSSMSKNVKSKQDLPKMEAKDKQAGAVAKTAALPTLPAPKRRKFSAYVALNFTSLEDDSRLNDFSNEIGAAAGLLYYHTLAPDFLIRTGAGLELLHTSDVGTSFTVNRKFDVDFYFLQLHIPATIQWNLHPAIGLIAGAAANLNIGDTCVVDDDDFRCKLNRSPTSLLFTGVFGAVAHFTPLFSMELLYNHGLNELAKDIKASYFSLQGVISF